MTCKFCNDTGCTACRMTTADNALRAEVAKLRASLNRTEQHSAIMDAGLAILLAAVPLGEIVTAGANFPDLATSIRRAYAARDGYKHTMTEARADLADAYAEMDTLREELTRSSVVIDNLNAKIAKLEMQAIDPEGFTLPPESERPEGYRARAVVIAEWRKNHYDTTNPNAKLEWLPATPVSTTFAGAILQFLPAEQPERDDPETHVED